jgi:ParB-like chromosome segregation protein Spo0J
MEWKNKIIGLENVDPKKLKANQKNWRKHDRKQRGAIEASLDHVGWVDTIKMNVITGTMFDGHMRVEQAIAHGEKTVPVIMVELTQEEEDFVLATLDPIGAMAGRDSRMQDALHCTLAIGTDDDRLSKMLESIEPLDIGMNPTAEKKDKDMCKCPKCGMRFVP